MGVRDVGRTATGVCGPAERARSARGQNFGFEPLTSENRCKMVKVTFWRNWRKTVKVTDPPKTLPPPYLETETVDAAPPPQAARENLGCNGHKVCVALLNILWELP